MENLNLVYFAMVADHMGRRSETLSVPETVKTVGDLLDHMRSLGEPYATALSNPKRIRVAVDQAMALPEASISGAKEIAIFPPVTGG